MFSFLKRLLFKTLSFVKRALLVVAQVILIGAIIVSSLVLVAVAWDKFGPEYEQYQSNNLPEFHYNDYRNDSPDKKYPIIALARKDKQGKEQFWCTAFVVSDKLALTAGHCLMDVRDEYKMTKDPIKVADVNGAPTGIEAQAAALNIRADLGMITADFSKFNKLPLYLFPGGILGLEDKDQHHFKTCGFAWGSVPILCTPFTLADDGTKSGKIGRAHV